MSDRTDRTDCPALELLAVAWHESGHAVGAVLVSPGLVVETATIVPEGALDGSEVEALVRVAQDGEQSPIGKC